MTAVLDPRLEADIQQFRSKTDTALEISHVSKSFGSGSLVPLPSKKPAKMVNAVHDVCLSVPRGQIFGILGANGSGKSTLIRVIATLLLPDEGHVKVFGRDVNVEGQAVKRMLNRVSVEASLFKKLSAMENLIYAARLYSVPVREAKPRIYDVLEGLGIPRSRVGQPVEKMSRGMQQKVAIARALLTSPVLLLLDEPTTGLDPRSKKDVQQFVRALRDEHDATVLLTSHDMEEADALCDRLAIIDHGKVIVEGTAPALKADLERRRGVERATLEDVFLEVTGHGLEEGEDEEDGV
ncbi:MAG: ABC transporter ATP-binding protein [Chloroflexota bacterium]